MPAKASLMRVAFALGVIDYVELLLRVKQLLCQCLFIILDRLSEWLQQVKFNNYLP